ncbi:MAG TPA: hypothetical protein VK879_22980 [Candidatus Sulfomarinibacteraceae bacterium]|nr:hypothetical protein [Candidatus Sulfomarinibacteraceae bacterium]
MHSRVSAGNRAVPVQPVLVILAALLIVILAAAFIILYMLPHETGGEIFAWPINPRVSSMMLGATYLGGAYFFAVVLLSRKWQHVWLGLLPVSAFAGTLGIATLLHWENFVHERLTFQIWAFLYFTVPLFLPVLWYRNQRLAPGGAGWAMELEGALPSSSRWAFGALGVIQTVAGLVLLVFPQLMIAVWPWTLSPLTARIMAAIFLLPGLTGLSMAYDGSWSSTRYLMQAQAFTVILMLIAVVVARDDIAWAQPTSWLFAGGLSLTLLLIVYTYVAKKR